MPLCVRRLGTPTLLICRLPMRKHGVSEGQSALCSFKQTFAEIHFVHGLMVLIFARITTLQTVNYEAPNKGKVVKRIHLNSFCMCRSGKIPAEPRVPRNMPLATQPQTPFPLAAEHIIAPPSVSTLLPIPSSLYFLSPLQHF